MIRIYHIADDELKQRVINKLAEYRGCDPSGIPDWFELDDADYSEILIELRAEETGHSVDGD